MPSMPRASMSRTSVPSSRRRWTTTYPKAQTTTNYQAGTVYYADNFTFDADIYYIGVNNNIIFQACNVPPNTGSAGETCALNTGTATYKGIEAEGTYAFDGERLEGLSVFLNGSAEQFRQDRLQGWIKQAPMWTSRAAAASSLQDAESGRFSLIDKVVGQQYSDNTNTTFYKLGAYNNMDAKGSVS